MAPITASSVSSHSIKSPLCSKRITIVGAFGLVGREVLGILESFASMREVLAILPGLNQIIIYLVAIIILLTLPRGLMGKKGVMED